MTASTLIHLIGALAAWGIAFAWALKAIETLRGLPRVPDLLRLSLPDPTSTVAVIVPALNEQAEIAACLQSLIAQDYAALEIIAVDDRSTDATGAIMDALAARHPSRLRVIHITELPEGWLGKTHAMALAARHSTAEFLLFTDADIFFAPSAVRRSVAYTEAAKVDHLVTAPTLIIRRWDEAIVLGFFQMCGLFVARPWRVADPDSRRDAIGVGAFNLVRRSAYLEVGGFESLRMEIVEDLGLARRIKRAGLRQHLVFGRDLVTLHWASGALGLAGVMTKNVFAGLRFHLSLAVLACAWLLFFCVGPTAGLFLPGYRLPAFLILSSTVLMYRAIGPQSGISAWNALLMPLGALLLIYALLRSTWVTLRQGGVSWRGTFYSLAELRRNAAPLKWF